MMFHYFPLEYRALDYIIRPIISHISPVYQIYPSSQLSFRPHDNVRMFPLFYSYPVISHIIIAYDPIFVDMFIHVHPISQ